MAKAMALSTLEEFGITLHIDHAPKIFYVNGKFFIDIAILFWLL